MKQKSLCDSCTNKRESRWDFVKFCLKYENKNQKKAIKKLNKEMKKFIKKGYTEAMNKNHENDLKKQLGIK
jgi:hypothetical protein